VVNNRQQEGLVGKIGSNFGNFSNGKVGFCAGFAMLIRKIRPTGILRNRILQIQNLF